MIQVSDPTKFFGVTGTLFLGMQKATLSKQTTPAESLKVAAKATVDFMKKKKGYWGSFGTGFRLTAGQTLPTLGA